MTETLEMIQELNQKDKPKPAVTAPKDFTDPDQLYQILIKTIKKYHPSDDISMIEKAYHIAKQSHGDQKRKSGEPYIIHPICVAIILAELELDKESIIAGLLHDVVEDTAMTNEDMKREFGEEIALLVDGVTKLTQIKWYKDKVEIQAENLRKMFLAMAKDIRVIMIKLADRLHNMRTLQYMKPEKQKEKARETMEIFAPIAERLGISKIKVELDDLALMYLEPEVYHDLKKKLELTAPTREHFIENIIGEVSARLKQENIEASLSGRVKHLFSIYKKMVNQNKTLDQIYDVFAIRVIVDNIRDCYAVLGVIHDMYQPMPNRFKDYIAMPKPNMYRSLHNTLIASNGQPFEIQIRTYEMHRVAEYGIAAHWKYKERGSGKTTIKAEEQKLSWLRQILEWQKDMDDNKEFLSVLKNDLNLFSESIYCFSPKGDVKTLPKGSTPIDFAYSIHSAVGNRMIGAKVNGKLVTIDYKLQTGERVEIITSQNTKGPSRDWLNIAKSSQARSKINQWFKAERKEENIVRGKELIQAYCKAKGIQMTNIMKPEFMQKALDKYGFRDWDSMMAAIGHGGLKEGQIVNKMQEEYTRTVKKTVTDQEILNAIKENNARLQAAEKEKGEKKEKKSPVWIGGVNMSCRFPKCCSPVPGDEIVGYVTRGRGVTVHRTDCTNIITLPDSEKERLTEAEWDPSVLQNENTKFTVELQIFCYDRVGMLNHITTLFTDKGINLENVNAVSRKQDDTTTITVGFKVTGMQELQRITNMLRALDGVLDVKRSIG